MSNLEKYELNGTLYILIWNKECLHTQHADKNLYIPWNIVALSYLFKQEKNWLKLRCQNENRQQMKEFVLVALFQEGCF